MFPWLITSALFLPLLLVAETIPVPVPAPLLLKLFLVLSWTYLSGALTVYYLAMALQILLGKIPDRIARWIANGSKAIILAVVYGFMVIFLVSILWDWSGGEKIVQALTRAPIALILAKPVDLLDFVGIGVSVLVPALLASYAGSQDIHLRLPRALYLASEMGGSLSSERPLQPGLWTSLRIRFRAKYRDMGTGPRAVTGLMLTLGMRSGVALMLAIFAGIAISLAIVILVSGHGWYLAVLVGGGTLSFLMMFMGVLLPTQITLPGTAGTYSTARLLPLSGPQLFRAHGILVWPIQLAVASFLRLYTYAIGGGPISWLVFGAVLTTELLATWGSQTGIFSGSGKPHGQGLPTFRLQWGVASICLLLLYPIEGYVAFTMVALSDLILDAYLISILAVNLALVAALTAFSIRRYGNPPGRGIGTGTPPAGGGQRRI